MLGRMHALVLMWVSLQLLCCCFLKEISETFSQSWKDETSGIVSNTSSGGGGAGGAGGAEAVKPQRAKAGPKQPQEVADETGEAKKKKEKAEETKAFNGAIAKAKSLRQRYDAAMGAYNSIQHKIATDEKWDWAKSKSLSAPMQNAKDALDDLKSSYPVWSAWSLETIGEVKKKFNREELIAELAELPL